MGYDIGRDRGEIIAETTFFYKARAKRRLNEPFAEPRNDAAADVDPTAGADCQRQVAGHGSEHCAEECRGLGAQWIGCTGIGIGDLRRSVASGWDPGE